jgi:hypothetical protein
VNDEQLARIQAKREQARYFEGLKEAAKASQTKPRVKHVRQAAGPKNAVERAVVQRERRMPLGTPCADCGRPLRLTEEKAADHPGTLACGGKRGEEYLCMACLRHWKGISKPMFIPPPECLGCERQMARGGRARGPIPKGWVRHNSQGYCSGCTEARRRER